MSSASRGLAPREGLECLLVKMGRTGPLAEPCHGPQAGNSVEPHFHNADRSHHQALISLRRTDLESVRGSGEGNLSPSSSSTFLHHQFHDTHRRA